MEILTHDNILTNISWNIAKDLLSKSFRNKGTWMNQPFCNNGHEPFGVFILKNSIINILSNQ